MKKILSICLSFILYACTNTTPVDPWPTRQLPRTPPPEARIRPIPALPINPNPNCNTPPNDLNEQHRQLVECDKIGREEIKQLGIEADQAVERLRNIRSHGESVARQPISQSQ